MDAQDGDEEQCHEADALPGPSEVLKAEAAASPLHFPPCLRTTEARSPRGSPAATSFVLL